MAIYDCFIFNDELDLLELRLNFLHEVVDHFILVESPRTISGQEKPLHYELYKTRFQKYTAKITHLVAPSNEMGAWEYEYYQRNYIKTGLQEAHEEDLVFITDVDEIVNIRELVLRTDITFPSIIELPMFNYFLNAEVLLPWRKALVAKWGDIKQRDLGDRLKYPEFAHHVISKELFETGWHLSYVFGYDIEKYQQKIRDFTHQEFNSPYYLDGDRIRKCIDSGIDIYERPELNIQRNNRFPGSLSAYIHGTTIENYQAGKNWPKKDLKNFLFKFRHKHLRRISSVFKNKNPHQQA